MDNQEVKKRGRKPLPVQEKALKHFIFKTRRLQRSQKLRVKKLAKEFGVSKPTLESWLNSHNFSYLRKRDERKMINNIRYSF